MSKSSQTGAASASGGGAALPAATGAEGNSNQAVDIRDVWSRSGPKYRVRAIVLLIGNVVLFAGLGCFAFWLRTGHGFAPQTEDYWPLFWRTFQPAGENRITLSDLLSFPISIYEVPFQIVVLGLLLAALVSIPIVVSILYRFWACIPFLLVVAFVAMMPWLAITLAGSCLLASVRPFRFSFRFASAMLGLVLVIIYFYSASRQSATAAQTLLSPADRIKFIAPWVLAIIASCVVFAIVLLIARLVNYRPGAITPALVVMFASPVALFEGGVGRDELRYRLLEHSYGPASNYFCDQDVSKRFEEAVYLAWKLHPDPKPSYESLYAHQELRWQLELAASTARRTMFEQHRQAAVQACETFLYCYPLSRYGPNALYIKAKAIDTRIDLSAFRSEKMIRFYDQFPGAASRHSWEKLAANAPPSSMAVVAEVRLAQLDAREGQVDQAIRRLRSLVERFAHGISAATQPGARDTGFDNILMRKPPESNLKIPVDSVLFETRQLLGLLQANRDPLYGDAPLCGSTQGGQGDLPFGLLQLDPRGPHYTSNLEAILKHYPGCQLADNIEVEIAKATSDLETRIASLNACIAEYPHGDALPEALFRLGTAYQERNRQAEARRVLERIASEFPDSVWYREADARLRLLPLLSEGATR